MLNSYEYIYELTYPKLKKFQTKKIATWTKMLTTSSEGRRFRFHGPLSLDTCPSMVGGFF